MKHSYNLNSKLFSFWHHYNVSLLLDTFKTHLLTHQKHDRNKLCYADYSQTPIKSLQRLQLPLQTMLFLLEGPQIRLVIYYNLWQEDSHPSESSISRSLALIWPCLELFPLLVPTFLPSIFRTTLYLLFLSTPSSPLLRFHARLYCVGYTPRAWDLRSLQSILDVFPLYFGLLQRLRSD